MDYTEQLDAYYKKEIEIISSLDLDSISQVMNVFEEARVKGGRIFVCGNGGSSSTASHFCCDFNKGVSMNYEDKYNFVCLSDNVATMMAVANDFSYGEVFSVPLKGRLTVSDVVVAISGSGNSANVVNALEYANDIGATTVGFVGYDGGRVKDLAEYCVHIPIHNMQIVEDLHMILDHSMMFVLVGQ